MEAPNTPMETQPVEAPVSNPVPMSQTSASKSKLPLIIAVVVLFLGICIAVIVAAVLILRNQPGSPIANIINNVTIQPLSESEQKAFFENSSDVFAERDRSYSMKGSSSSGDYEIAFDVNTKITKYSGTLTGDTDSEFYITPDKTYYKMEGQWFYMDSGADDSDSGLNAISPESMGISSETYSDLTGYKGIAECPGTTKGNCHKFELNDSTLYTGEMYFLANGDLVYFTTSYTDGSEVQTADFVYDSVKVELPEDAKNAKSFDDFLMF
jgi:hypothetical protein